MNTALKDTAWEIKMAFWDVAIEIAQEIHGSITPHNFNRIVHHACQNWLDENRHKLPFLNATTDQLFCEVLKEVLLKAYEFETDELTPYP